MKAGRLNPEGAKKKSDTKSEKKSVERIQRTNEDALPQAIIALAHRRPGLLFVA